MAMLPASVPTTILAADTPTLRPRVTQRTRRTPVPASSFWAVIPPARAPSFHPRALLLGGEDPAHDLARLDLALRAPELAVAEVARRRLRGRDRGHLRLDAVEAVLPPRHVRLAQVHPARPRPVLHRLRGDGGHGAGDVGRDLAIRPAQQPAVGEQDGD